MCTMEIERFIPFKIEIVRPPDSLRESCPIAVWPKICDLDYKSYAGTWTVVGQVESEIYGTHYLAVQPGRIPMYIPRLSCRVVSVEGGIHLCPICNGAGYLQCPLPEGLTSASGDIWRKECYSCGGKGWIQI